MALLSLAACGLPDPPNIRQEFAKGIRPLGVVPFYPLNEGARLGQVYLADAATVQPGGDKVSYVPTNVILTNAAVPFLEKYRAAQLSGSNRFPCSSDKLSDQITLDGQSRSYYLQTDCAPAAAGGSSGAGSAPSGTVVNVNVVAVTASASKPLPTAVKPSSAKPPGSLTPLELAGIPSYSLASIDNVSLTGAAPTGFANFLAAIGFRRSISLSVEAEGVEVASLPSDAFAAGINDACNAPNTPFSNGTIARAALIFADHEMHGNAETRQIETGDPVFRYDPRLLMLRKVYYLRGIRYIFSDTRAYSAVLEAAASGKIPLAQQPPATPNISMNVVTVPQGSKPDAVTAQMAALQTQMDGLRSAMGSSSNIQVAGTSARATARGIEFVDLFQRPLAFGYVPISERFDISKGLADFCASARGIPPT